MDPPTKFSKNPIKNGIPPLITKNSTDLLPINIRAGLTKDSQPSAILHQRQVNRLEIPVRVRRKSAHEMRCDARENGHGEEEEEEIRLNQKTKKNVPTSGIYIPCQINGMCAFAQVNTCYENSALTRETASSYGHPLEVGEETFCAHLQFSSVRCRETFTVSADVPFGIIRIGLDILKKYRCILDFSSSAFRVEGDIAEPMPFLTASDVFKEVRLEIGVSVTWR